MTKQKLEAERRELLKQLQRVERRLKAAEGATVRKTGRSLRDLVLDALEEIGFMTYTAQLVLYIDVRFGRRIEPARFGTLAADEKTSFTNRQSETSAKRQADRLVWLCHGLTHDRGEPVKRLWARSDWPLQKRTVTPAFGRAQFLRAAAKFAELASRDGFAADAERLKFLAADHARDLGIPFRRGEFDLSAWREVAETQLEGAEVKESAMVEPAAADLQRELQPAELLFGRDSPLFLIPQRALRERQA